MIKTISEGKTNRFRTVDLALIAMFAAIMAVCSWISIPASIPFTMQTFGVFLTIAVLGGKKGTAAVLVYLLLGLAGAPVFAGFSGGIGCLFGSTGGYIIGFLFSALVMWTMEGLCQKKRWMTIISMTAGLLVCYAFGTVWYMAVYTRTEGSISLWTALAWCVVPYIIPDMIKIALAYLLSGKLRKILKQGKR